MKNLVGIRARFVSAIALSALAALGSGASAQESKWSAEGRISANQAFLIRWMSPEWSIVTGGGLTHTTSGNVGGEQRFTTANAIFMLRKERSAGPFHPFFGFGPNYSLTRNETEQTSGSIGKSIVTTHGIAGRLEIGGLYDVHSHIALGVVGGATAGITKVKTTSTFQLSGIPASSNTDGLQASLGNIQFVMRVRF